MEAGGGTAALWAGLRRPLDAAAAVDALLGISHTAARQLVGVTLAASAEAEILLTALPHVVRSLAVATTVSTIRCTGQVRGAVLWSETMAARSASPGAHDIYICASSAKAYDTAENQVLVRALLIIRDAAQAAEVGPMSHDEPDLRQARHNGALAIRFLDHRTLSGVGRARIDGRRLRRTRAGTRRHTYEPALAMIERHAEPVTAEVLQAHCGARTLAEHDVVGAVAEHLALPRWLVHHEMLVAGPVRYRPSHGIVVAGTAIDLPEEPSAADIAPAVEAAVAAAT